METSITLLSGYAIFFMLQFWANRHKSIRLVNEYGFVRYPGSLMINQVIGISIFCTIAFLCACWVPVTIQWISSPFIPVLIVLIFFTGIFSFQQAQTNKVARVNFTTVPANSFLLAFFITRIIFISSYEIFFRAIILNHLITVIGTAAAIVLNVILYAALHIYNNRREVIACIPFGTLLCFVCIYLNSIWPAILLHLSLTLPYELALTHRLKQSQNLMV